MFRYHQPTEIIFGNRESSNLGRFMEERGLDRALLIADPIVEKMGIAEALMEIAKGRILAVTTEVDPNPSLENIQHCMKEAERIRAGSIIAIGGGSAIDCAKSVAAALSMGCSPQELMDGQPITSALPIIAIPTTSGTGSEVTAGAVISDKTRDIKKAIFGPALFPRLAIVDPVLTHTCPPSVTASTGLDVLSHALDALSSVKAQPSTDVLAVEAARRTFQYLERAVEKGDDPEARENMSMASLLAGMAFSQTGTTATHACSYILTAKYKMPHGEACAFTMDGWFPINAKERPVLETYSKQMGFENAVQVSNAIMKLKEKFGMKTTLEEAGIPMEDIEEIADSAMASANMTNNIAKITKELVVDLFMSKRKGSLEA